MRVSYGGRPFVVPRRFMRLRTMALRSSARGMTLRSGKYEPPVVISGAPRFQVTSGQSSAGASSCGSGAGDPEISREPADEVAAATLRGGAKTTSGTTLLPQRSFVINPGDPPLIPNSRGLHYAVFLGHATPPARGVAVSSRDAAKPATSGNGGPVVAWSVRNLRRGGPSSATEVRCLRPSQNDSADGISSQPDGVSAGFT